MELSLGLIKADIKTAEYALKEYLADKHFKDIKNICGYHIQQAVEKLIKYQIYNHADAPDNKELYTHNIGALIAYADRNNIPIYVPDYIVTNAEIITMWETGSRYDLHFSVRVDTLEKTLGIVIRWFDEISKSRKQA